MIEVQTQGVLEQSINQVDCIVSIEEMKKIVKESLIYAKSYAEFYTGIINAVYDYGFQSGYDVGRTFREDNEND